MPPSIAVAALLLFSLGAAALVDDPLHGTLLLAFLLVAGILLFRHQRWSARPALLLLLLVYLHLKLLLQEELHKHWVGLILQCKQVVKDMLPLLVLFSQRLVQLSQV